MIHACCSLWKGTNQRKGHKPNQLSIYFCANNSRFSVQPAGSLDIYFENAKILPENEIDNLLNWNISELDTTVGHNYLTVDEKMQYKEVSIIKVKSN